jgi:hypothetical protein
VLYPPTGQHTLAELGVRTSNFVLEVRVVEQLPVRGGGGAGATCAGDAIAADGERLACRAPNRPAQLTIAPLN